MGQKTNPTVLRLEKTNQHFAGCWYGHYYYSDLLHNNLKIRDYIGKIFQKINRCRPLVYIKNSHQSNMIWCFFLKKRIRRYRRFKFTRQSRVLEKTSKKWSAFYGSSLKKIGMHQRSLGITGPLGATDPTFFLQKTSYPFYPSHTQSREVPETNNLQHIPSLDVGQWPQPWTREKISSWSQFKDSALSSQPRKTLYKHQPLLCSVFHKQSFLLKEKPVTKTTHKTRIENTINFSNFHWHNCHLPLTVLRRGARLALKNSPENYKHNPYPFDPFYPFVSNYFLSSRHDTAVGNLGKASFFSGDNLKNLALHSKIRATHTAFGCAKKTHVYPIKVSKITQNSDFIAQKIINDLKKRIPYNRFRRQILRDVARSQFVKGIRVTLSGRVKSQSKKAQKARTNTFHWGQTELHVFSSLVQFTNNHCITPFGKIGIKVWVCYHS